MDITGIDLVKFIQEVYNLSKPQGMGHLHFKEGDTLSEEEAKKMIHDKVERLGWVVCMDYMRGRSCKMTVWEKDGRLTIYDDWLDHGPTLLKELLLRCNFVPKKGEI